MQENNDDASVKSQPMADSTPELMDTMNRTSSMAWRRQRLLNIGADPAQAATSEYENHTEQTSLADGISHVPSYGTLPSPQTFRSGRRARNGIPLPEVNTTSLTHSVPPTPSRAYSREHSSRLKFRRTKTISTYDPPLSALYHADRETKWNGIRVWYSSFTSVDWLHDAIKESSRLWQIRSRKSFRGQVLSALDRSVDWTTVTIVGFLTAIVAFFIIRSEKWFFDLKEGRCLDKWWLSKRLCADWQPWSEAFGSDDSDGNGMLAGYLSWIVEYAVYVAVALSLAFISSTLTIYLTASPTFVSDKDSGVLSPDFDPGNSNSKLKSLQVIPPLSRRRKVLYYAAGSGIPEIKTILSGFVIHGYLGGRTLFTKAVGLSLSVASGLSLGKEGPFVHIASCIGNIVSRYFQKYETNEGKRREILSASAAAGVAVAFGAPIGGVLFSLEEVSYYFPPKVMWQSFFCAMIAAVTLRFLDPFGTGKLVLFQVTYDKDWHAYELIFFLILGVFGGVYGAYFSKLNYRWSRHVRNGTWLKAHPIAEVLLVTLATTMLCFLNPFTRMGGTELVANLFAECRSEGADPIEGLDLCTRDPALLAGPVARSIGVALLVKGALTVVTFGIKLPAGIFIPTLGVGACAGRILGIFVQYWQWKHPSFGMFEACRGDMDCVIPGLYAMVGAAAALSGVTRTTVSLAVIMFELTDTLTYAVPVMLSILTAKTVADALEPKGIYDLVIDLSELPYLDAKREYIWGNLLVSDVTDRDVDVIRLDQTNTVKSLRDKLLKCVATGYVDSGFPILRPDIGGLKMVGYIGVSELEHALAIVADHADATVRFNGAAPETDVPSSPMSSLLDQSTELDPLDFTVYMDQAPLTVQTNSPLELVQQLFAKLGARYVIVTDPNGFFEGVIDKNTWIAFVNDLGEH